jgi:hypothetical protein
MKLSREKAHRNPADSACGSSHHRERGFAYLMALFLALGVIIASQVAMQNILTAGRRDREADMIWRGNQYMRAIRLYYKKTGHYPQDLEQLEKGQPELHFLRSAALKDPMSSTDGEWRYIYVNATGQIIGSVKYASLQQMALMDLNAGQMPGAPGLAGAVPASSLAVTPGLSTSSESSSASTEASSSSTTPATATTPSSEAGSDSSSQPGPGSPSGSPSGSTFGTTATGAAPPSAFAGAFGAAGVTAQKPTGPVDGPVLGAFLTGVVSKSERPSIKVYKHGKKYSEWEFIWNPLEDQARAAQQGMSPQGALPGQSGQPAGGIGGAFGLPSGTSSGTSGAAGSTFGPSGASGGMGANPAPSQ